MASVRIVPRECAFGGPTLGARLRLGVRAGATPTALGFRTLCDTAPPDSIALGKDMPEDKAYDRASIEELPKNAMGRVVAQVWIQCAKNSSSMPW